VENHHEPKKRIEALFLEKGTPFFQTTQPKPTIKDSRPEHQKK